MGFVGNLGAKLRERKRVVTAVLSITVIVVGVFLAGTWAGSSGAFTGGSVKAATQQVPEKAAAQQAPDAPKPEGMCCDKPMAMNKGPNPPSGMPMGKMGAGMSDGMSMANTPMANMPMGKMGAGMSDGMSMANTPMANMPMGKMGAEMSGGMPMTKMGPNMASGMPMPVPDNTSAR
jgi:hypothetical protein